MTMNTSVLYDPAILFLHIHPIEIGAWEHQEDTYKNVHSSTTHRSLLICTMRKIITPSRWL